MSRQCSYADWNVMCIRGGAVRITLGSICRGHGKIYALVKTKGLEECTLSVRSVVRGGEEVPARLVELETGETVLVLAVLAATQTVTLCAYNKNGIEVCRLVRNVGRKSARLSSQAHTFFKAPIVDVIRNCDQTARPHEIQFVRTYLSMGAANEPDYLHITLCYPLGEGEDPKAPVQLRVFHPNGCAYNQQDIRISGDMVHPHWRLTSVPCRYLSFSVCVPRNERFLCMWAVCDGQVKRQGIECLESFVMDWLRDLWMRTTTSNEPCEGYEDWFYGHRASAAELELQRAAQHKLVQRPKFSLVVPLYHTPLDFFSDMAESVLRQTYENFELILVNSTPEDESLRMAVDELQQHDERVRVVTLNGNLGITENTNAGIAVAEGDFVSFFDHDDLMEPDLLYWYAMEVERNPQTDMLYCDEDKFENGHYSWPFFKPDWSPLFLETNNYVCHLLTVRRSLIRKLPVPTKEFDGAQDHRMALLAGAQARHVAHVGRMLYHWRVHEQSTAVNVNAKPEALEAGRRAIALSLDQRGIDAQVYNIEGMAHCYRVEYPMADATDVSIVVLNDGTERELEACLEAIRSNPACNKAEVLVASCLASDARGDTDDLMQALNATLKKAACNNLVLLSSRVAPKDEQWLGKLVTPLSRQEIGVVGGRVDFVDGTKARGSIVITKGGWSYANKLLSADSAGSRGLERLNHESMAVAGECLALRKDVLNSVGGITAGTSELTWFIDLCLKVRGKGLAVTECPGGMFVMAETAADIGFISEGECEDICKSQAWLKQTWPEVFGMPDPYYSANLGGNGYYDLTNEDGSPALRLGDQRVDKREDDGFSVRVDHMIMDGASDIVRGEVSIVASTAVQLTACQGGVTPVAHAASSSTSDNAMLDVCHRGDTPLTRHLGTSSTEWQCDSHVAVPTIGAFDVNGEAIATDWVLLGDSTFEREDIGGWQRQVSFSLRIPSDVPSFVVRASMDDGRTCSFEVSDERVRGWKEGWRNASVPADQDVRYDEWFRTRHRATPSELALQRRESKSFVRKPTFSIIVPLYKTPLNFLAEMVESVLAQSYELFELILINASPEDIQLERTVQEYLVKDSRVREVRLAENKGITLNTNVGIEEATGTFLAFLDHDDVIEPDLLYWYAKGVNDYPTTDLLYCDEDHLIDGAYGLPFFKTDWDLDRLRSENYVCHMLAVRKSIVDEFPELPGKEMDGSQDHNMTLMVGEKARNVYHVRRVLYHWRAHEGSTAGSQGTQQKSYALEAERLAVQNHLDRCEEQATAVMGARRETRVDVQHRFDEQSLVSIVIPNKDMANVLRRCVRSILDLTSWKNYEVVVVENGSVDQQTFQLYSELEHEDARVRVVTCVPKGGFNFSELINYGFAEARGEYLLMLNNDTEVITSDWVEQLLGICQREDVGSVGAKLLYPDDTIQHMGVIVGKHVGPVHANAGLPADDAGYYEINVLPHRMSAVTGACMLTKRSVWEQVGRLDEGLPVDYNDIDYCLKLQRSGYANVVNPNAVLRHYESVTRNLAKSEARAVGFAKSVGRFNSLWYRNVLFDDPYFSASFAYNSTFYRLNTEGL